MDKPTALITIDDSPTKFLKDKADILSERNIRGLFFSCGNLLEEFPDQAVYAIQKGHVIANHAYSHKEFSMMSIEKCREEISKTDEIIDDIYKRADVGRGAKLFRFPYGDKGISTRMVFNFMKFKPKFRAIQSHLDSLGYEGFKVENVNKRFPELFSLSDIDIYWTFDIKEWPIDRKPTKDIQNIGDVMQRIDTHLTNPKKSEIILLHDHEETHKYFAAIMDKLISKGFSFDLPKGI